MHKDGRWIGKALGAILQSMKEADASCPHRADGEICESCAYERIRQALVADPNRLDRAADIVRRAARALVGADGITLVVREG